jgi:hypothetical protein
LKTNELGFYARLELKDKYLRIDGPTLMSMTWANLLAQIKDEWQYHHNQEVFSSTPTHSTFTMGTTTTSTYITYPASTTTTTITTSPTNIIYHPAVYSYKNPGYVSLDIYMNGRSMWILHITKEGYVEILDDFPEEVKFNLDLTNPEQLNEPVHLKAFHNFRQTKDLIEEITYELTRIKSPNEY